MKPSYRYKRYHFIGRWCYTLVLLILLPLVLLKLLTKKADTSSLTKYRNAQRFGILGKGYRKHGILVHCVSMGEVNAAVGLIKHLISKYPSIPITVSTTSVTGAKQAENVFGDSVQHLFLPIDIPVFNRMLLKALSPKLLLVTEVEIWPNLIHQCYKRDIHCVLVNARMTNSSLHNYKRLSLLFRPCLRKFSAICAQGRQDFDNFLALGVYKTQLTLTNNLKYDLQESPADRVLANQWLSTFNLAQRKVLLGASTHDGEEKVLVDAFKRLKATIPNLLLVLVPRYPDRFDDVIQLLAANGLHTGKTAKAIDEGIYIREIDVLVVNQMGSLKAAYCLCDMAFVGGSFVNKGGHNPLEAALYAKPICMGPSQFNNLAVIDLLKANDALKTVTDLDDLCSVTETWMLNPEISQIAGRQGYALLKQNAGALNSTIELIDNIVQSVKQ